MKTSVSLLFLHGLVACATQPAQSPEPLDGPPSAASAAPAASVAPAPPAASSAAVPGPAAAPSEAEKTQQARNKADADHRAELARWTPELREQAKRLALTTYASTDAALKAVLASPHRQPGNAARDAFRHPRETLEFFGLKPTSSVLEYGPGGGWFTELLAPALAQRGKLFVTSESADPASGPRSVYGYRLQLLFATSPELYGKVQTIVIDAKQPKLGLEGQLDLVLVLRELHNIVNEGALDATLSEFRRALKPGGVLGIEGHRASANAEPLSSSKLGYLPEAWAIQKIEAAGFKLSAKSEINANPRDTKDYAEGVWTLPPSYRLGDKDREKYAAIGESDRFTLRFVKSAEPKAVKASAP